ncbi:putative secreted protein (Por secretion system target) [Kordia periserrulae]|uniref:Putative secreted protein (Por secretion system target) n=1 Tax=Kordia periserrulae TaxID=701523 RepID=A0A2T6C782_9FLAO|nr:T9SS type A sorting domain-containing protein [Kordia periserrulae]PTX64174.1 putative secreted protein (Por secretion system target) [Kordia periserrulae]
MKKITLILLFCAFIYQVNAQCTIDPFIQQHYEKDAKMLALREILMNPSDPDYNNPFVPSTRAVPYLEKLSAIYLNPSNDARIDSLFNEFQFHVNPVLDVSNFDELIHDGVEFFVNTNVSWVQPLKDTGISGNTELDNLLSQYQLVYEQHFDNTFNNITVFTFKTNYDVLNFRAIIPEFEVIQDILSVFPYSEYPIFGPPYTGISYVIYGSIIGPTAFAEVCDIRITENGIYEFFLAGGDCFAGCNVDESRYVTVSDDCSTATFSRTLSNENFELTNVSVYPNPASNHINIQGIDNIRTVEIHSILGKKMHVSLSNSQIDISRLKSGVYFLKITDNQNHSVIKKFVKK